MTTLPPNSEGLAQALFQLTFVGEAAAAFPDGNLLTVDPATRERHILDLPATFRAYRVAQVASAAPLEPSAWLEGYRRSLPAHAVRKPIRHVCASVQAAPELAAELALAELTVMGRDGLGEVDRPALLAAFSMLCAGQPVRLEPHSAGSGILLAHSAGALTPEAAARLVGSGRVFLDLHDVAASRPAPAVA